MRREWRAGEGFWPFRPRCGVAGVRGRAGGGRAAGQRGCAGSPRRPAMRAPKTRGRALGAARGPAAGRRGSADAWAGDAARACRVMREAPRPVPEAGGIDPALPAAGGGSGQGKAPSRRWAAVRRLPRKAAAERLCRNIPALKAPSAGRLGRILYGAGPDWRGTGGMPRPAARFRRRALRGGPPRLPRGRAAGWAE